jgi:hypothetical protein
LVLGYTFGNQHIYAKGNNALNMEQLYWEKMKKVHSNEKYGDYQLIMCSKFKICAMPRAKV